MNRFIIKCLSLLSFVLLTGTWGYSQLTTVNLTSTQDSYTDSRYPTSSYANAYSMSSNTYLIVSKFSTNQYYRRSYVEFDLSSIPSNAVVYSASLDLTRIGPVTGGATWNTKLITSSWSENTLTSNFTPTISTLPADNVATTPSSPSYVDNIDVTAMVQRMVYGQISNYGWSVQVNNEAYFGNSGGTFHTRDQAVKSYKPKLIINYYIPLSITSATITHESATGVSDGGVGFTFAGGASDEFNFYWYDASGTLLSSSLNDDTAFPLGNQPFGWYGLHMVGTTYGEELYYGFLVGTDCEEVTITFQADLNYTDNAYTLSLDRSGIGGTDYTSTPYPNATQIRAEMWTYSYWYQRKSYLDFHLWMDDAFTVNQADLTLTGVDHSTLSTTNESRFDLVTQDWTENSITWDSSPTSSTSTTELIASTTSSTQNNVIDMTDFWDGWKADNTQNYGTVLSLQNTSNAYHRQAYVSPVTSSGAAATRPTTVFKLSLLHTDAPYYCNPLYAAVERQLTGVKYKTQLEKLYFYYNNEYTSPNSYLSYKVFKKDDQLTPVLVGGVSSLPLVYGRNEYKLDVSSLVTGEFYVLEVTNDKDEKFYLRFEKM